MPARGPRRTLSVMRTHARAVSIVSVVLAAALHAIVLPSAAPARPDGTGAAVRVYLTRGEQLGVAWRAAPANTPRAAMRALLAGPTAAERAAGLGTVIPAGTRLRGLAIRSRVATVDLTRTFESGGGSLSMLLRVAQVVHTLTRFPGIDRVAFRLGGRPVEAIGGEGIVVDPPVGRADFEGQAPPILVETPSVGEPVTSPLSVSGSANVFEAQLALRVLNPRGRQIAQVNVLASAGTGTRGRFAVQVPFRLRPGAAQRITLVAYAPSARDGRPIAVVRIPLDVAG
jgi:hypothetical protein